MQLKDLNLGAKAKIKSLKTGDKAYRNKLIAMGLIPGTQVTLERIAPLGDPIEISVRGYALSLRKDEAQIIELHEVQL